MFQTVISRVALGRAAHIGALYDVREETFVIDSLFNPKIDDDAVDTMELGDTSDELVMSDSIQDKFHKLDIEAELQVSLLAGLVKLVGSGAYLKEEKKSTRSQSMSLIYKIRTINEEIMLRQNKNKIDTELLTEGGDHSATHVVVSIDWGAVCSITCKYENTEGEDKTIVEGKLMAQLKGLKFQVDPKASAKADYRDVNTSKVNKFTFKCETDVSFKDEELPLTFKGALDLAKRLPKLVKKTNDGKGVPILYRLVPLDTVVKICKLPVILELHFATIREDAIKRSAQVWESITEKRQRLFDIQTDLRAFGKYVADDTLETVNKLVNEIEIYSSFFRDKLKELVTKIRRKDGEVSALDTFLNETLSDSSPIAKYKSEIGRFQADFNKVNLIKSWNERGIIYLGKNDQLIKDDGHTVYVLHKPRGTERDQNEDFFIRYQKTYARQSLTVFKVVDEAISPDLWPPGENKATIKVYKDGVETCRDLFEKEGRDTEMCLIKLCHTVPCGNKPSQRALVKIICPNAIAGNEECSKTPIIWKCAKCKQPVEYGLETRKFYCKCGESEPSKSSFRCNEKTHRIYYTSFPDDILHDELRSLRAMCEKNILILGETGVGKSTWINGIVNYLNFSGLLEAKEAQDYYVTIPSQFTFIDKGQPIEIKVGDGSDNETHQAGHSATQKTRAYVFYDGDQKIRLIDTPGIGDTRGVDQDKKNFDNILAYLSFYDEIHAVCILLTSNNSRLTTWFKFCLQELLVHLHTSAKDNIVFCFTNARETFYKPGDTLPPLNSTLTDKGIGITANPNNCFCFDNEPFRFLACSHSGIDFSEEDIKTYASSWDKAVDETKKLFRHINNIFPHELKTTLSINDCRRVIVAMIKPMATVAETIQENRKAAEDATDKINLHKRDITGLAKFLKFTGFDLIREELPYPRTVCAHSKCIERVYVGKNNTQQTNYKQVCHPSCYLEGIPTETTNDSRLQGCSCITGTICRECGHDYSFHMHLTYELKKASKEFISEDVQKQIMDKITESEKVEEFKSRVGDKISELQSEESMILKASAMYASFLKNNALIPYNDAFGDYLDMLIRQEEDNEKHLRGEDQLQRLKDLRAQYEHEKQLFKLDKSSQKGETTTLEDIRRLRHQLFDMKHFGKTLEDIFDGISISRSTRGMCFQETVAPVNQRKRTVGLSVTIAETLQAGMGAMHTWVQNKWATSASTSWRR